MPRSAKRSVKKHRKTIKRGRSARRSARSLRGGSVQYIAIPENIKCRPRNGGYHMPCQTYCETYANSMHGAGSHRGEYEDGQCRIVTGRRVS